MFDFCQKINIYKNGSNTFQCRQESLKIDGTVDYSAI